MNDAPIITDDDARELFRLNTEVTRTRNELDLATEVRGEKKKAHEKALDAQYAFVRGLSEEHPLFNREATP